MSLFVRSSRPVLLSQPVNVTVASLKPSRVIRSSNRHLLHDFTNHDSISKCLAAPLANFLFLVPQFCLYPVPKDPLGIIILTRYGVINSVSQIFRGRYIQGTTQALVSHMPYIPTVARQTLRLSPTSTFLPLWATHI